MAVRHVESIACPATVTKHFHTLYAVNTYSKAVLRSRLVIKSKNELICQK